MYALLYIEYITNSDLLYSTGNSTQCFIITHKGKNLKKNIYVCITESLWYILETETTL